MFDLGQSYRYQNHHLTNINITIIILQVRQKTPHPKELKAKAHKLFGSPTKSADNTGVSFEGGLSNNGEFINGIQKKEDEAAMEEQDEGIPQQDLEDEEDEEAYKGEIKQ